MRYGLCAKVSALRSLCCRLCATISALRSLRCGLCATVLEFDHPFIGSEYCKAFRFLVMRFPLFPLASGGTVGTDTAVDCRTTIQTRPSRRYALLVWVVVPHPITDSNIQ